MSPDARGWPQELGASRQLAAAMALLVARIAVLEDRIRAGDEAAWEPYLSALNTLITVLDGSSPGGRGEMLTTSQMASRLGIAPKTLLKHKAAGAVKPALQRGRLIRWKGDERPR